MLEKATFGAGCFWGVQEEFDKLNGVIKTMVGYSGGHSENPTYKVVCSGNTGHAEVLQIEFDNEIISYEELLKTFWNIHNPTTPNRQKKLLEDKGKFNSKIVTEIVPFESFFEAEDYHQKYYKKNKLF